jgi:hypothetical protein
VKINGQPPIDNPQSVSDRLLLLEWQMARIQATLASFTRALWTVAATVIGALVVYYLTSRGVKPG